MAQREPMEKIKAEIEAAGCIKRYEMWRLRDAAGWGKLGSRVVVDIANELEANGIGYLPANQTLPTDQNRVVSLYIKSSPLGRLVQAVLEPSKNGDERLREAGSSDAAQVVERIRSLVCQS